MPPTLARQGGLEGAPARSLARLHQLGPVPPKPRASPAKPFPSAIAGYAAPRSRVAAQAGGLWHVRSTDGSEISPPCRRAVQLPAALRRSHAERLSPIQHASAR